MPQAKIKEEFKTTFIAFGGRGYLELGQRDDIDQLAIMAIESQDNSLLQFFEQPMPSVDQLKKAKTDAELLQNPNVPVPATEEVKESVSSSTVNTNVEEVRGLREAGKLSQTGKDKI
jgi:hypothetical protein